MAEYKVQIELFEGPMDLLLYLVRKQEVDIYEVNLTKIATEFIEYIEMMREFDLEIAGEFLVMASTLMYIKSKELLPVDKQVTDDQDEEEEDPRWELIRQLVEYKKFKDVASELQDRAHEQENTFVREAPKPQFERRESEIQLAPGLSIFDLIKAVNVVVKRFEKEDDTRDIYEEKWTVSEKIELIRDTLFSRGRMKFSELFTAAKSRGEVVVTFLAMLELIRMKQMIVDQPEPFAEIEISKADPSHAIVHDDIDEEEDADESTPDLFEKDESAQDDAQEPETEAPPSN